MTDGPSLPGTSEETPDIRGSGTIPDEYLRDCEWSESPIYGCDHCRRNGTFDPSQYSFVTQKTSNRTSGTKPGMTDDNGKYIRSEWPTDLDLRRIVEGWQRTGHSSPHTKYARYELTERDRNPVDEAFQRGIFGKGRPGVENVVTRRVEGTG